MFDDVVADFWKDKLVHLMHRNMARVGAERLAIGDVKSEFENFEKNHPDFPSVQNISGSYATWEISVTNDIKLRLFIQAAVKVTLLQQQGSDFVKIADARFPNNPFPEIHAFLEMRDEYVKMLASEQTQNLQNSRKMKIARQFIIALLKSRFEGSGTVWELEEENQTFKLTLKKGKESQSYSLGCYDFAEKIRAIE